MNDVKNWQVKANDFIFSFGQDEIDKIDCTNISAREFSLLKDHRSFLATIINADISNKKIQVEVDGETILVEIKDELDQMLDKMGFRNASGRIIREIKAPMPGMVLEITAQPGMEVNPGDKVLVLEAMKMENSITVTATCRIKKILVNKGDAVIKGQVLVELE